MPVRLLDTPLDLVNLFGPMSAMHAAMDKLGAGMPCGLIARFHERNVAEIEVAIAEARRQFPVLGLRLAWVDHRPVLAIADQTCGNLDAGSENSLFLKSNSNGPLWRYRVVQDGHDTWLSAIWNHAAADGPSMLRFLETIVAIMARQPVHDFKTSRHPLVRRRSMARWLVRFLFEQSRRYVRPTKEDSHPPGVTWCIVAPKRTDWLRGMARAECGSFAAWLAAASCIAFCQQQNGSTGRVLLNLPIQRGGLERLGGFGFRAGSLLMPVKLDRRSSLPTVARRISKRLKEMIDEGWDENFERFLGNDPKRHLRLASLHARGLSTPVLSVSWKGSHWHVGGMDGIRDVACFAVSSVAHISGHIDRNGLSVSVASTQLPDAREVLLRRLITLIGGEPGARLLSYDDAHAFETVRQLSPDNAFAHV
jgi:hypothetical protein